jgi:putative NIF3 family GTP cyclohydrolase 1 type 2
VTEGEPWEIPVYRSNWFEKPEKFELPANRRRRELHEAHRFAFFQYHSPLDGWPLWSTGRALAEALGFDPEAAAWPSRFIPILDLNPQPLRTFATRVRDRLGLLGVGVSGNLEAPVHRALLAVGGLGASWAISEVARKGGADVMVTGELSDYTVRAAREAGIAVLKASHYSTENPAVRKLCQFMETQLAGQVACRFLDCGESWHQYGAAL